MIINKIDKDKFIYYKNELNSKGVLGITHNRIVEIPNFVDEETAKNAITFFENCGVDWGHIAFYGSKGMGLKPDPETLKKYNLSGTFFSDLKDKFQEAVETVFDRPVKANTSHAQKWVKGGFAAPHSDSSDYDGKTNSFSINKYVGILYLNDDYENGHLYFIDDDLAREDDKLDPALWCMPESYFDENLKKYIWLDFKPNKLSYYIFPGGVENIHGVSEITEGTRYTMVSFWDYAEAEYSDEQLNAWEEEEKQVRLDQEKQREDWAKEGKTA